MQAQTHNVHFFHERRVPRLQHDCPHLAAPELQAGTEGSQAAHLHVHDQNSFHDLDQGLLVMLRSYAAVVLDPQSAWHRKSKAE